MGPRPSLPPTQPSLGPPLPCSHRSCLQSTLGYVFIPLSSLPLPLTPKPWFLAETRGHPLDKVLFFGGLTPCLPPPPPPPPSLGPPCLLHIVPTSNQRWGMFSYLSPPYRSLWSIPTVPNNAQIMPKYMVLVLQGVVCRWSHPWSHPSPAVPWTPLPPAQSSYLQSTLGYVFIPLSSLPLPLQAANGQGVGPPKNSTLSGE